MAKKVRKAVGKAVKRSWYPILAPALFNNQPIGESPVTDARLLLGKTITVNLMTITGDPKKYSTNVMFKVNRLGESKGFTDIVSWEMLPSAVKRLIRRNKDRIDESILAYTADGLKVRIKPLVITRGKAKSGVTVQLRMALKEYIIRNLKKTTFDNLIQGLVTTRFQKAFKEKLNKIYPIAMCDIRMIKIIGGEKKEVLAEEKPAEAKEEPPKEEKPAKKEAEVSKEEKPAEESPKEKPAEVSEPKDSDDAQKAKPSDEVKEKPQVEA